VRERGGLQLKSVREEVRDLREKNRPSLSQRIEGETDLAG
jgi:hypothetical protein